MRLGEARLRFQLRLRKAKDQLRATAENPPQGLDPAQLYAAVAQLERVRLPDFDKAELQTIVDHAKVQVPIPADRHAPLVSNKLAGFVDLVCTVYVASRVDLWFSAAEDEDFPLFEGGSAFDTSFPCEPDDQKILKLMADHDGELPAPDWLVDLPAKTVWVDIRPEVPPVGQLLQELKTLQQLAGPYTAVLVLFGGAVSSPVRGMLRSEGFSVATVDDLAQISPIA
jgi:hypothetical protein